MLVYRLTICNYSQSSLSGSARANSLQQVAERRTVADDLGDDDFPDIEEYADYCYDT